MSATRTRQEQFDQQALVALTPYFPVGATVQGSVVTLPVPPGTPPSKLAAGSIRVSKGRDEMISPEIQWDSIVNHCQRQGIFLRKVYLDMHKSGRVFEKRAVAQIVEEVKAGEYLNVVLWKWSRWGRNVRWSQVYLGTVEDAGATVRSASEDLDPKTPIGKFTRTQLLALAELESDMKSEGWKETHAHRRGRNLPHTGNPRFGYEYVKGVGYKIDEERREIVSELYDRFGNRDAKMGDLVKLMHEKGYFTLRGERWTPTSLGRMLDTGFAAGLIRERSDPPSSVNNKQTIKQFDIWREGAHEPLIDMATWEAYRDRRLANSRKAPRHVYPKYALSGMLTCAECGSNLSVMNNKQTNKRSWYCPARQRLRLKGLPHHAAVTLSERRILRAINAWIDAYVKDGENIQDRVDGVAAQRKAPAPTNLANLTSKRMELQEQKLDYTRQKARRRLTEAEYDMLVDEVNAELEELEAALATARVEETRRGSEPPARAVWESLPALLDQAAPEEMRTLLATVLSSVIIDAGPASRGSKVRIVPAWA